jgi:hypothetical protein
MSKGARNRAAREFTLPGAAGVIHASGVVVDLAGHRAVGAAPVIVPGEHLWIVLTAFRVTPREGPVHYDLDPENLVTVAPPGCYVCERKWSPQLAARPCPGNPG